LLKRELSVLKLSAKPAVARYGVPSGRITDILNSPARSRPTTAVRLGRYFGNGAPILAGPAGQYDIG